MEVKLRRLFALFIDHIVSCALGTLGVVIVTLGSCDMNILSISVFFLLYFLSVIFKDSLFRASSFGKKIMCLKVLSYQDAPSERLSIKTQLKRNVFVLILPVECWLIFLKNRRLGDMVAKTEVISIEK